MSKKGTELSVSNVSVSKMGVLTPSSLKEAIELAELYSDSGMVPKQYIGNPGAILVAIQMGAELGLSPMAALQNIAVINGRPALWGDAVLAVVKSHPEFVSMEEYDDDTIRKHGRAKCLVKRKNQPDVAATFTIDDAKQAGLWARDVWKKYPMRMLRMRARGFALRDQFPDALRGIGIMEELRDKTDPDDTVVVEVKKPSTKALAEKVSAKLQPPPEEPVVDATKQDWPDIEEWPDHDPETGEVIENKNGNKDKPQKK